MYSCFGLALPICSAPDLGDTSQTHNDVMQLHSVKHTCSITHVPAGAIDEVKNGEMCDRCENTRPVPDTLSKLAA